MDIIISLAAVFGVIILVNWVVTIVQKSFNHVKNEFSEVRQKNSQGILYSEVRKSFERVVSMSYERGDADTMHILIPHVLSERKRHLEESASDLAADHRLRQAEVVNIIDLAYREVTNQLNIS